VSEPAGAQTLKSLTDDARARVDTLLAKGWSLPAEHALARLDNRPLGEYRLIVLLGPKNNVGSRYFQLLLLGAGGGLAEPALALGLHNSGQYPGYNWLELVRYDSALSFTGAVLDLTRDELDLPLFQMLSEMVPEGGHIMVEYDSPGQKETERVLTADCPDATSPLGYLMFRAGCRSYRNWYISEGGREGPRKLQGFKPLNAEIAADKEERLRAELRHFLARPESGGEWLAPARLRARYVLEALAQVDCSG